jgi:hypothetical protein
MLAAVAYTQLDDLRDLRAWKTGEQVADLTVGVVTRGVKKCRGQFHFKGLGALDQIHQWRLGDGYPSKQLCSGLR